MINRIGRKGASSKRAKGIYSLKYSIVGRANLSNAYSLYIIGDSATAQEDRVFQLQQDTIAEIYLKRFSGREQSHSWSSGTGDVRRAITGGVLSYTFDSTIPIEEGTPDCLPENDNFFSITSRLMTGNYNGGFTRFICSYDWPSVVDQCRVRYDIELICKFDKEPTILEPDWKQYADIYSVEKW